MVTVYDHENDAMEPNAYVEIEAQGDYYEGDRHVEISAVVDYGDQRTRAILVAITLSDAELLRDYLTEILDK
jgi:hypothetical protein